MKVVQNTPEQFILEERPWFFAAIMALFAWAAVYGLVTTWAKIELTERALLAGLAMLFLAGAHYFIHWVRAEFDRTTGRIDVVRRGLFYARRRTYSLRYLNQVLVEEQSGEGATYRAVLVFDKAMLSEMDPERRERLERRKSQGLRQAAAHEAPLTVYYSSISDVKSVAKALNTWLGATSA